MGECENCVGATSEATQQLLEYGLQRCDDESGKVGERLQGMLDRLRTYTLICDRTNRDFSPADFASFRSADLVDLAMTMARRSSVDAVHALFTYHADLTLPHRARVLSSFPETDWPATYSALLPKCSSPNHLEPWPRDSWQRHDADQSTALEPVTDMTLEDGMCL